MNSVIVKTDLETAEQFRTGGVSTKVKGKKNIAYLRVQVDDFNIEDAVAHAKSNKNIVMLAYTGLGMGLKNCTESFDGVYVGWVIPVADNITEEDVKVYSENAPEGVSVILKFNEGYKNFDFMCNIMSKFSNIRICGGCTFCFEDCRFGCCGRDILKSRGIKFDEDEYFKEGCSCALNVMDDEEVTLTAVSSSARSNSSSGTTQKKVKAKIFNDLLFSGGKVAL